MNLDYKQIGKNLARRRKELRLKQYEVCERAGINDKYLSCIETARSIPSLEVFLRLCEALETTPDHILLGSVCERPHTIGSSSIGKVSFAFSKRSAPFPCIHELDCR